MPQGAFDADDERTLVLIAGVLQQLIPIVERRQKLEKMHLVAELANQRLRTMQEGLFGHTPTCSYRTCSYCDPYRSTYDLNLTTPYSPLTTCTSSRTGLIATLLTTPCLVQLTTYYHSLFTTPYLVFTTYYLLLPTLHLVVHRHLVQHYLRLSSY